jgi:COP9 signalosome complex subunit 7
MANMSHDTETLHLQRLQPYLEALGKDSNTNRAVVMKAFADPDLFVGYNQIQMAGTWDDKTQRTLDLFSYGCISDNTSHPDQYLPLNDAQLSKLRQLTVLGLIQKACLQRQNVVSYSSIQQALQMSSSPNIENGDGDSKQQLRDTESILAQLIAAKMIAGNFSQKERAFHLAPTSQNKIVVRPRDVRPSEILELIQGIQHLRNKLAESNAMLNAVEKSVIEAKEQDEALWEAAKTKYKDRFEQLDLDGSHNMPKSSSTAAAAARRQKRTRGGHHGNSTVGYASRPFGA